MVKEEELSDAQQKLVNKITKYHDDAKVEGKRFENTGDKHVNIKGVSTDVLSREIEEVDIEEIQFWGDEKHEESLGVASFTRNGVEYSIFVTRE